MKKLILIVSTLILIAAGVVLVQNKKQQLQNLPTAQKTDYIDTVTPKRGKFVPTRTLLGTVRSHNSITYKAKVGQEIDFVAKQGTKADKNDPLLRLDSTALQETISQKKASLHALRQQVESMRANTQAMHFDANEKASLYERNKKLFHAGAISKEALDKARLAMLAKQNALDSHLKSIQAKQSELQAARHGLKAQQNSMRYYRFDAPFDGEVARVFASKGEITAPNRPVFEFISSRRELHVDFSPSQNIQAGDKVAIKGKTYKIKHVFATAQNFLHTALIDLGQSDLKVGTLVEAALTQEAITATLLPKNALLQTQKGDFVYIYENGRFVKKQITIKAFDADTIAAAETINAPVAAASPNELMRLASGADIRPRMGQ